jgi:hypothetical protein
MNVIPHTRQEWLRFLLFPFKAFVVVSPVVLLVWFAALEHRGLAVNVVIGAQAEAAFPVALGLIGCVAVFLVVGLIQLVLRRRNAALMSFGFAVAAFLVLSWVLPMCAVAYIR